MNENLEDQIKPAVANFKRGHVPSIIWMPENKRSKISKRIPKRHYCKKMICILFHVFRAIHRNQGWMKRKWKMNLHFLTLR